MMCCGERWTGLDRVPANHTRAKVAKFIDFLGRTGVMRSNPPLLRREAECESDIESFEGLHLPIEPRLPARAKRIGPAQTGTYVGDAQFAQPSHGIIQAVVFKMEPLANSDFRRVAGKRAQGALGRAVFA